MERRPITTSGEGSTRIRLTTDYAKATGAEQASTLGDGGWWWLRSPYHLSEDYARDIRNNGNASFIHNVNLTRGGVVPALCIPVSELP